ncbi:MAG: hypothetical protein E7413_04375 [Ruminococcaceae bacterium]|nr:hypothetical protein [Oscillospiraceae bacterium]
MKIQSELLKSYLAEALAQYLQEFPMDIDKARESIAMTMLEEIKEILENPKLDDFEKVEDIFYIFQSRKIKLSNCHDCF